MKARNYIKNDCDQETGKEYSEKFWQTFFAHNNFLHIHTFDLMLFCVVSACVEMNPLPVPWGLKLAFTARYGNDRNERMQVFNTEVEIPHKVELEIGYIQGWGAQYECPSIEYDVTGKANFLKDSANQPEDLMKILMCLICLLLVDYTSGPHLCPGEKVLLVRKDYADGPPKTCEKKSYLAGYMIAPHESQEINNFLYEGNFNLMSVLWLLSEFALIKFCNGI